MMMRAALGELIKALMETQENIFLGQHERHNVGNERLEDLGSEKAGLFP